MATEAVAYGGGLQAVFPGSDQVVLAVTDHQGLRSFQFLFGEQVGNQLDLVGTSAVQLAAVAHLEVMVEGEGPGDLAGKYRRLGSGGVKRAALVPQVFEHLQNAVETQVVVA